jgi:hypothetical protein
MGVCQQLGERRWMSVRPQLLEQGAQVTHTKVAERRWLIHAACVAICTLGIGEGTGTKACCVSTMHHRQPGSRPHAAYGKPAAVPWPPWHASLHNKQPGLKQHQGAWHMAPSCTYSNHTLAAQQSCSLCTRVPRLATTGMHSSHVPTG